MAKRNSVALVTACLCAVMSLFMLLSGSVSAQAIASTPPGGPRFICNGRCYVQNTWWGSDGIKSSISEATTSCGSCSPTTNDAIIRTTWLGDNSDWARNNCWPYGGCWVENGLQTNGGNPDTNYNCVSSSNYQATQDCYYWDDSRPCGGGYHWHYGTTTNPGFTAIVAIAHVDDGFENNYHDCEVGNNAWSVSGGDNEGGSLSGESDYNTMDPKLRTTPGGFMSIGSELISTPNSWDISQGTTDWNFNQWGRLDSNGVMGWTYQNNVGISETWETPFYSSSGWVAGEDPTHNQYGGDFQTGCCI